LAIFGRDIDPLHEVVTGPYQGALDVPIGSRGELRVHQSTDPHHALGPSFCCVHARKNCAVPRILVKRGPCRQLDSTTPGRKEVIQVPPIRIWFCHHIMRRICCWLQRWPDGRALEGAAHHPALADITCRSLSARLKVQPRSPPFPSNFGTVLRHTPSPLKSSVTWVRTQPHTIEVTSSFGGPVWQSTSS
jgi:hypothetical protein